MARDGTPGRGLGGRDGLLDKPGTTSHGALDSTQDMEAKLDADKAKFNIVAYGIMMLLGLGILLPWNVALNSFDFLDTYYGQTFNFWLSGAYVWPQVIILVLMVKYGKYASFTTRIILTFMLQGAAGIAIPFLVGKSLWSEIIVLLCCFGFGVCAAVLQSSLIGFSSQFPTVFNQSLMAGQGVAGILAGVLRVATKAAMPDKLKESAIMYFAISSGFMVLCTAGYLYLLYMPFTQHHLSLAKAVSTRHRQASAEGEAPAPGAIAPPTPPMKVPPRRPDSSTKAASGTPTHHASSMEMPRSASSLEGGGMGGRGGQQQGLSTPLLEQREQETQALLAGGEGTLVSPASSRGRAGSGDTLRDFAATPLGLKRPSRVPSAHGEEEEEEEEDGPPAVTEDPDSNAYILAVALRCWKACAGLWLCYFLTFFVFPSETAKVDYHGGIHGLTITNESGWWGIIMVGVFNIFDTIGRFSPGFPALRLVKYHALPWFSAARVVFVVLFVGAARQWSSAFSDWGNLFIMVFFALTNGYTTTSCFMAAPEQVNQKDKETAGFIMSFFLLFGMFSGTMAALSLS